MNKTNYKGFTYYELLIVIAIMSLMVGFTTITIGTVHNNNVKRTSDKIESSIKAARNNALSKGSDYGYANFYYISDTLYCNIGKEIDPATNPVNMNTQKWDVITKNADDLYVRFKIGSTTTALPADNNGILLTFGFKQSTGECIGMRYGVGGTVYTGDFEFVTEKGNNRSTVNVGRYGVIEIK